MKHHDHNQTLAQLERQQEPGALVLIIPCALALALAVYALTVGFLSL